MKTIIENSTNISKYVFEDSAVLNFESTGITTPNFIIGDLNSNNATLVEGVTPPEDWIGCKYIYADSTWTLNPAWEAPEN